MTTPPDPSQPEVPLDYAGQNIECRLCPMAMTSFFLGLLSIIFFYFAGIPAIILGFVALSKIRRNPQRLAGLGYARAGIVTGMLLPLVLLVLLPSRHPSHERARRLACSANIKGILIACVVYASDNNDHFPLTLGSTSPTGLNFYSAPTSPIAPSISTTIIQALSNGPGGMFSAPNTNPVSSLWILALQGTISTKSLLCKTDPYADSSGAPLSDASGHVFYSPQKPTQNSYSIAYPWDTKGPGAAPYWRNNSDPNTPLLSDMALRQALGDNVTATGKKINSPNHNGEGQNVGFADCHTEWIDNPNKAHPTTNESIFHYGGYDPATKSFSPAQKQSTTGITLTDPSPTTYDIYMVPQRDASGMIH